MTQSLLFVTRNICHENCEPLSKTGHSHSFQTSMSGILNQSECSIYIEYIKVHSINQELCVTKAATRDD